MNPAKTPNTANTAKTTTTIAPPPRSTRLISGLFLAAFLFAIAPAAQTQTLTLTASVNGGPNCAPDCQANEGDTVAITIGISGVSAGFYFIQRTPFDGDAIHGEDYTSLGGNGFSSERLATSNNFQGSQDVVITDDNTFEPAETITLTEPASSGGNIAITERVGFPLTITILASDQPVFSVAADDADTTEGDTAVFTVTLGDTAPAGTATVQWGISGVAAGDWSTTDSRTLRFTGLGMQTVSIVIEDDDLREGAETLTFTLSNPSEGVITVPSATTTIAESDQPHVRALTVTRYTSSAYDTAATGASIAEGNADTTLYFAVGIGGDDTDFTAAARVNWTVNHSGTQAADFTGAASGNFMFPAGSDGGASCAACRFSVVVAGDMLNEATEAFSVDAAAHMPTAQMGTGAGTSGLTITDNDPITATLSGGGGSVAEGGDATIMVALSGGTATADVVLTYRTDDAAGSLTLAPGTTSGTLTITATDDALSEDAEMFTVDMNSLTATSAGAVNIAAPQMFTINADADDNIAVTVTANSESASTGGNANFTVRFSNASMAGATVTYSISGIDSLAATGRSVAIAAGATTGAISIAIPDDAVAEGAEGMLTVTATGVTVDTGGGTAMVGTPASATVTITSDDAAERAARVEAPLASSVRGIGQLAAGAVVGRMTAAVAGGNTLTVAGQNMAGDGMETLAAQYLASGRELSAAELLRQSGFSFTHGDGGRGFNFWGGGSYVSADGDHDGVSYDGDTTSFHVGVDTNWRDGLIGVAIGTSDGDTDFTVTADGMKSTLETDVTSVHPYLTRKFGGSQLWITAGHGSGDAELKEPGTVIKTDVTVTTAAFGISHARGDVFVGGLSALYSRAKLDAATGDGKSLPATTADGLRISADAEVGKRIGAWRPFALFAFRHDSGDGDTGGAADLGGGLEYRTPGVLVRLEGSGHIQGQGPDESRVTFTARKSTGRVTLGLNLGADETGLDTARLLHGEWRF